MNKFQLLVLAGVGLTTATSVFMPYFAQAKGLNESNQPEARRVSSASGFENYLPYSTLVPEERPRCQGDPPECKKLYPKSVNESFTLLESNVQVFSDREPRRHRGKGGAALHDDSYIIQVEIAERSAQVGSYSTLDDPFKLYARPRGKGAGGGGR